MIPLVVAGAGGRMGRAVLQAALADPRFSLAGGVEAPGSPSVGADLGRLAGVDAIGVLASDTLPVVEGAVVVDFSAPAASLRNIEKAAAVGMPVVTGVTGLTDDECERIASHAAAIPVLRSENMSLGINLLAHLVETAARSLGPDYDIEIVDSHHRRKVDAPSGTALLLARAAARGRGVDLASEAVRARDGLVGPRRIGAIGFAVVRGGGLVGDHDVVFAAEREVVTLSHRALDRSLFADGALAAAAFVAGKAPGLYDMRDVLGFSAGGPAPNG